MDIKQLKPNRQGRFKQGYINPKSCKKLFESEQSKPIIYRSSWEKRFMEWCEKSQKVKQWGSECTCINYYNPVDKKEHRYFPDFVVELQTGEILIVEIKPHNQTVRPDDVDNVWAMRTWAVNAAKWATLKKLCEERGYHFCILTEKTINRL